MEKVALTQSSGSLDHPQERSLRLEGFVDEGVVRSMVSNGAYQRSTGGAEELVLSSTEDDFAGWNLPAVSSFRGPEYVEPLPESKTSAAFLKQANPLRPVPESEKTVLSEAKRGFFWWLGFSGALACTAASLAALGLVQFGDYHKDVPTPLITPGQPSPEKIAEDLNGPSDALLQKP